MADRHHRAVAPLCKDGRLFVPGDQVVFAVDAYNGTLLWHHTIPGSRRLGAFLDASNMAVDDHYFYYVDDDVCHVFDVATGQAREPVPMPQLVADGTRHWGYLAVADELIVGSGRKPEAVYTYPLAYKLHTGEPVEGWKFERRGHGCGDVSASVHHLFWRGGNPQTWDLRPGGHPSPINRVTRPGCWINIIPAEGMLLIPEASSGCTCSYPLQTSLAYVPVDEQN